MGLELSASMWLLYYIVKKLRWYIALKGYVTCSYLVNNQMSVFVSVCCVYVCVYPHVYVSIEYMHV